MSEHFLLQLAGVLALGIGAQWVAWRLRLPSILLLLLCGFLAGPVLGHLKPDLLLGDMLMPLVSISVGLILFEGGLTLKFSELKSIGKVVRNLITLGALVTGAVATLGARFAFGWDWSLSLLMGSILIVTGPTVIMPLLRHIQPSRQMGSTLKWEGILIDPVGAVTALLVFEAIMSQEGESVFRLAMLGLGKTILIGGLSGLIGAWILTVCFKHYWVPDFLQNPVTLTMVVGSFTLSNHFQHESGLLTVTIMGIYLANQKSAPIRHVLEFKENLRVLLISVLFILLSARLNPETVRQLSIPGCLGFLAVIMLVARPLSVWLSTMGSTMKFNEKLFLAWMAPRGIVAAAIASIFALRLDEAGYDRALELVPATFLVIVSTVTLYGLTSGPLAMRLGLSKPNPQGVIFLGATPLARTLAKALHEEDIQVMLADTNHENLSAARMEGLAVYFGNILSEHARDEVELTGIGKLLAMTANTEINTLAALHFIEFFGRSGVYEIQTQINSSKREKAELHGRPIFARDIELKDMEKMLESGAVIRKTRLTETFSFEDWRRHHSVKAIPLFILTDSGVLKVFTVEKAPTPLAGQTLIALIQPDDSPREKA